MTAPLTRRAALSGLAALAAPSVALAAEALPAASPAPAAGYRGPGVYLGEGVAAVVGAPIQGYGLLDGQFVPKITIDRFGETVRELRPLDLFAKNGLVMVAALSEEDSTDLDAWVAPNPDVALLDAAREALDADKAYCARLDQCRGLSPTEAEEADLDALGEVWQAAVDRTLSIAPHTPRGVRAVLQVLAVYEGLGADHTRTAISLLLGSPALAGDWMAA